MLSPSLVLSYTFIGMLFVFSGCNFFKSYPQDNIAEEIVEEVIEAKTGLDLDLSPLTPEK